MTEYRKQVGVLIVDDSPSLVALLRGVLHSANYKVLAEVNNGKSLRSAIEQHRPEIILLDYNLPDSNGLSLLKAIKSSFPQVMVVMLTGESDPQVAKQAAEFGASGFINKPFTVDNVLKQLQLLTTAQNFLKSHIPQAAQNNTHKTAVIADDSKTMRSLLTSILAEIGVTVVAEASNGKDAVTLARQYQPDLVCLDIDMPVKDGLQALDELNLAQIPSKIVMVTGNSSKNSVIAAVENGAKGFIVKPYDPVQVSTQLERLLKG